MAKQIEVFQDMALHGPVARRSDLRRALLVAAVDPWQVDVERSDEVANNIGSSEDVIMFRRAASDDYPPAELALWGTDDGYYVPNVVPIEHGSLSLAQYNAILNDFIERVVVPVAGKFGFTITTSKAQQGVDDWLSSDAAVKLRRFSSAANKSTGASHPLDQRRWFDFIITAHRAGDKLDSERLARWLHEVERWDERSAHELAGDFEGAIALLTYYDEH